MSRDRGFPRSRMGRYARCSGGIVMAPPGTERHRHFRAAWWAAVVALSVILLAPLLITDVPPVLDYPNHMARLVLLAAGNDDRVLGPIFTPDWTMIPNLAGDVIGLALLHVLPIHLAGRCLLGGILLLNLAGVLALHRAYFGRRSFWPLGSGLVAYNCGFLLGFLNWQISSGLAMLCAAGWLIWRQRRPVATITTAMAAAVLLFFCHPMGLVYYFVLIGSAELHEMRDRRSIIVRLGSMFAVLAGPVVLATFAAVHDAPAAPHWPRLDVKLVNAAGPFINYMFPLDMVSIVLVYGGIGLGIVVGWLIVTPRAVAAMVTLPLAYFALPFDLMGGSFLDLRFAVMFGFLVFAAVDLAPIAARASAVGRGRWIIPRAYSPAIRIAIGCWMALFAVRMTILMDVWAEQRQDIAELRAVIAAVPPGAKVFFTNVPPEEAPDYWDAGPRSRRLSNGLRTDYHLPALLLIERGAFWPVLFANPAQQPIRLQPAYAKLAQEAHDMPSHAGLAHSRLAGDPDNVLRALCDFDFVLMLEAGADENPANFIPRYLALESRSDFAALFRVRQDQPACDSRAE
jgi:hypothetical protein